MTLLKATASIYPEWMNAPTDETREGEKMGATQPEMTRANQAVISKTCSGSLVFLMQSGWGGGGKKEVSVVILGGLWLVFYSSESKQVTESSPARLAMTREWLLRFPARGGKMRCSSRWRHSAEKVGVETKMCLFMPTGVLTLLRAAFAFCQERELKGHSQDVETSTPFCLSATFCLALPPSPPPPLGQQLQ